MPWQTHFIEADGAVGSDPKNGAGRLAKLGLVNMKILLRGPSRVGNSKSRWVRSVVSSAASNRVSAPFGRFAETPKTARQPHLRLVASTGR